MQSPYSTQRYVTAQFALSERETARRIRRARLYKRYVHEAMGDETFEQWLKRTAGF